LKKIKAQFTSALKWAKMELGHDVAIGEGVLLKGAGFVAIGDGSDLSGDIIINVVDAKSRIIIGSNVIIAGKVRLVCHGNGEIRIGAGCTIADGVTVICNQDASIHLGEQITIRSYAEIVSKSQVKVESGSVIGTYTSIAPREPDAAGIFHCGRNCYIHAFNFFDTSSSIELGDEVRTGPYDVFYTHDHPIDGRGLIWDQAVEMGEIIVGNGAWIGSHATLLKGINIGKGAVVGAGAVVTQSVENFSIVGGVPARLIRMRVASESLSSKIAQE